MRVFAGAGEASGDRILAAILHGLRERVPNLELRGFGGPLSAAEGLESPFRLDALAVNGIGDVLRRGAFLWRARARLQRDLESFRPDLVLLVDYPGMNVALARRAKQLGIPVHYVAPPQLWAYRNPAGRQRRLRTALGGSSLQFLFPFEAAAYEYGREHRPGQEPKQEPNTPWPGRMTQGHFFPFPAFPSDASDAADPSVVQSESGTRLLLCPGSRRGVLHRNLPLWLGRVRAFFGHLKGVDVLVPDSLADDARSICGTTGNSDGLRIVTDRDTAFARAGAAVAFPGTITLELFLQRIPVRVWAVLDPLTLSIGKRKLRGPHLALPSVIHGVYGSGRALLPEWVGSARDFARTPPEIPDSVTAWNPVPEDAVAEVWTRMGSDQGIATGVHACLELLGTKVPAA